MISQKTVHAWSACSAFGLHYGMHVHFQKQLLCLRSESMRALVKTTELEIERKKHRSFVEALGLRRIRAIRSTPGTVPWQVPVVPAPLYPDWQLHINDPFVFVHRPLTSQLCVDREHSFMSEEMKKKQFQKGFIHLNLLKNLSCSIFLGWPSCMTDCCNCSPQRREQKQKHTERA